MYGFKILTSEIDRVFCKTEPGIFHLEKRFNPKTGQEIKPEKVFDVRPSSYYELNGEKITESIWDLEKKYKFSMNQSCFDLGREQDLYGNNRFCYVKPPDCWENYSNYKQTKLICLLWKLTNADGKDKISCKIASGGWEVFLFPRLFRGSQRHLNPQEIADKYPLVKELETALIKHSLSLEGPSIFLRNFK